MLEISAKCKPHIMQVIDLLGSQAKQTFPNLSSWSSRKREKKITILCKVLVHCLQPFRASWESLSQVLQVHPNHKLQLPLTDSHPKPQAWKTDRDMSRDCSESQRTICHSDKELLILPLENMPWWEASKKSQQQPCWRTGWTWVSNDPLKERRF